jgi:hypothetical protein
LANIKMFLRSAVWFHQTCRAANLSWRPVTLDQTGEHAFIQVAFGSLGDATG